VEGQRRKKEEREEEGVELGEADVVKALETSS